MTSSGETSSNSGQHKLQETESAAEAAAAALVASRDRTGVLRSKAWAGGTSIGTRNGGDGDNDRSNLDDGGEVDESRNVLQSSSSTSVHEQYDEFVPLVVPGIGAPKLSPSHHFTGYPNK